LESKPYLFGFFPTEKEDAVFFYIKKFIWGLESHMK